MSWYSYFLLSVPEAFILPLFLFVLFGISIRDKLKPLILFAFIHGGFAFLLSMYFENSYKPFLTFGIFFLLLVILFRFKVLKSLFLTLTAFIALGLFEVLLTLFLINVFPIDLNYAEILSNPWKRILFSYITLQIPLLILTFILLKLRIKIKLPQL
ncbi:signal transduction histidine kinase [Evansella vedderi]|uniref:Signal transduction histidine kinase n=1 Tax=Evansella vedderi TaxID=38282 RepID=A0ABT9ZP19_9BACI|nr:hypothetical protein [Evansella vedderi]MDQ0252991.1 signal transduction histidine kinase [Evansella vedderi]